VMAVLAQGLDDEIDVYHAWKFTADECSRFGSDLEAI
jgi:hypothetical protein